MLIPFGVDIHENQFLKNCEEYLKKNGEQTIFLAYNL